MIELTDRQAAFLNNLVDREEKYVQMLVTKGYPHLTENATELRAVLALLRHEPLGPAPQPDPKLCMESLQTAICQVPWLLYVAGEVQRYRLVAEIKFADGLTEGEHYNAKAALKHLSSIHGVYVDPIDKEEFLIDIDSPWVDSIILGVSIASLDRVIKSFRKSHYGRG
jgi:hypothetical protein